MSEITYLFGFEKMTIRISAPIFRPLNSTPIQFSINSALLIIIITCKDESLLSATPKGMQSYQDPIFIYPRPPGRHIGIDS